MQETSFIAEMSTNQKCVFCKAQICATDEDVIECDDDIFQLCRLNSKKGTSETMLALALCYHFGWGTDKDVNTAIQCYIRAAELGGFEALDGLWRMRGSQYAQANLRSAFRHFVTESDQDDWMGQFNEGYCHYWGIGTPEDTEKAKELFLKTADQGYVDALQMLEECRIMVWRRIQGDAWNRFARICRKFRKCRGPTSAGLRVLQWKNCLWHGGLQGQQAGSCVILEGNRPELSRFHIQSCLALLQRIRYVKRHQKGIPAVQESNTDGIWWCTGLHQRFLQTQISGLSEEEYPVGIDYFEAVHCNSKAVDQNNDFARESQSDILKFIGLTQDYINVLKNQTSSFESSKTWYNTPKQYEAGDVIEKDKKKAFKICKLLAISEVTSVNAAIGRRYEQEIGAQTDARQVVYWRDKAVIQAAKPAGDAEAAVLQNSAVTRQAKIN